MSLQGYFDVFPEKTATELRTATIVNGDADDPLPDGKFIFTEYFCTDPRCNCQRVLVKVFHARSEDSPPVDVAAINYSWNANVDEKWRLVNSTMPNPFLDRLHRQAPYASELLQLWITMIKHDGAYASRLQRHYGEIRAEVRRTENERQGRRLSGHDGGKNSFRPLSKQERAARKRLLDRIRRRK